MKREVARRRKVGWKRNIIIIIYSFIFYFSAIHVGKTTKRIHCGIIELSSWEALQKNEMRLLGKKNAKRFIKESTIIKLET